MFELRQYQESGLREIATTLARRVRRVLYQLSTGGGKTVMFAAICHRYITKSKKRIVILVHREELLEQTRLTLWNWHKIDCGLITAKTKKLELHDVYVCMVETFNNRQYDIPNVGMCIIDECHLGNFKKIHDFFETQFILGFTATPISADIKDPLKNYFDEIICGIDVKDLIKLWRKEPDKGLVQNITYRAKSVDRKILRVVHGEFDKKQASEEYSKAKHVLNTVEAYKKHGKGRAIVYNCSIEHSRLVAEAFKLSGYDARSLDSAETAKDPKLRRDTLAWFKATPNAILCNVNLFTTGTDIPEVETIIVNLSTKSLTKWLQMCGRGGRPYPGKNFFIIIDMGDNALEGGLGDWSDERDWKNIFYNPPKPKEKIGVASHKECPKCERLVPVQTSVCPECGYLWPREDEEFDKQKLEFEIFTKGIDVERMVHVQQQMARNQYALIFDIGNSIALRVKNKYTDLTPDVYQNTLNLYLQKVKEWCRANNKKYSGWHSKTATAHYVTALKKHYPNWTE